MTAPVESGTVDQPATHVDATPATSALAATTATTDDDAGSAVRCDGAGLWFAGAAAEGAEVLDVLFDGAHVWSFRPDRDVVSNPRGRLAPWPGPLRQYLDGVATVTVQTRPDGDLVMEREYAFGRKRSRIKVVDKHGHPLVVDKWGRLERPLSAEPAALVETLMTTVVRLLDDLRDGCGVPAFLVYGTLLGAVRDGKLIGYDNDVDLGYLSRHDHPVDIAREGFRVQRELVRRGWVVRRGSGGRLNVRLRMPDGTMRFVDVFTCFWVEDTFYIPADVWAPLPREAVLPLRTVELMGVEMAAPADPEALLAATYGPSWRVPDPSFRYETPPGLQRRLVGWFGGIMPGRKHWDGYYGRRAGQPLPPASTFARWVGDREGGRPARLVDLGCGRGQDALALAQPQRPTLGVDYSLGALAHARSQAASGEAPAEFEPVNFAELRAALALGARLAREPLERVLYARFLLGSLDDAGRENLWRTVAMALRGGGRLYVEFRAADPGAEAASRQFDKALPPGEVAEAIVAAGGRVTHREKRNGLAPDQEDNPLVCRMAAEWPAR